MTTFMPVFVHCAVCGAESQQHVLASTSTFGPPDLDLRPNGPARWALELQIQHCPSCGYCANRIGERAPGTRRTVASPIYRDVLENARMPVAARRYFCAALIGEATGQRDVAASHFLEAAWVCDDAGAVEQARICRDRAAEMMATALEWGEVPTTPVTHGVRADVLRRAGRYEEALAACAAAEAAIDPEIDERGHTAAVLGFIRELVEAGDEEPHSVVEAFASEE
jgi:hypothetical protein